MNIICLIMLTLDAGGINVISEQTVKGKVIGEGSISYLVDFSNGIKKYDIVGNPKDYSEILVSKDKCIKL